ncbi:MAG: MMPL family transporter [Nitrosomonas sp.]|nr:MAG: MMPL family transporter [Nitrosomonas sp.]
MVHPQHNSGRLFAHWVDFSYRHALWVILLLLTLTGLSAIYTADHLGIHTDTTDMLSEEVPFRANHIRYLQSFPQHEDTLVLVLDAPTPEQSHQDAKRFTHFLQSHPAQFSSVYYLTGEPFFEKNGLLFSDLTELGRITDHLSAAQPMIARIVDSPTLYTFSSVLTEATSALRSGRTLELQSVFDAVSAAVDARLTGIPRPLSWQALLGGEVQKNAYMEIISVKPALDYSQIFAAEQSINNIRVTAQEMGFTEHAAKKLRITGEVALAHDELNSAMHGAQDASVLALIMVAAVLLMAFRSIGPMIAIIVSLILGLLLTAALATVTVGYLNLISIAFAVLYIGLGVDYAIHFLFRLKEIQTSGKSLAQALSKTGSDMGQSLLICALTTAIGFYAFIPTTYRGVAELGIISGSGMLISFLVTMTLLPAMQRLLPIRAKLPSPWFQSVDAMLDLPRHASRWVYGATVIAIIVSITALPHIRFDYNLLNLNNPHAESITTFQELLKTPEESPWYINILTENAQQTDRIAQRLRALPEVDKVISILDLVPQQQDEKSALIEEMAMIMGPISFSPTAFLTADQYTAREQYQALEKLAAALNRFITEQPGHAAVFSAQRLHRSLTDLLIHLDQFDPANGLDKEQYLRALGHDLIGLLPESIQRLQLALSAQPFVQQDLPASISELWRSHENVYRIAVYPKENINDNDALRRFVRAVQTVAPDATGVPVISLEAGEAVVDAFIHAFSLALIGVTLGIWLMLRSALSTLLVLAPLLLAALFTGAGTVWMDLPFNFANIIALPLLLGIGIDSSLHMVHRSNAGESDDNLLHTSTARAIFYSAMTTLVGFGSLIFSTHQGTASMGLLLTIGLFLTLVCALIILPVLLQTASQMRQKHHAAV